MKRKGVFVLASSAALFASCCPFLPRGEAWSPPSPPSPAKGWVERGRAACAGLAVAAQLAGGVQAATAAASASPAGALPQQQQQQQQQQRPLVEAWDLANKFYIDRTFNGLDWAAQKDLLLSKVESKSVKEQDAIVSLLKLLGDKYTRYVDVDTYQALSKYDMIGAGVLLSPNQEGRMAVAAPPNPKSQAAKLGIAKGDIVTAINGRSTADMNSFDAIEFLSKYKDPTITFTIKGDEGRGNAREIELDRKFPQVPDPIVYSLVKSDGHRVGYMRIKEFNALASDRIRQVTQELKSQGADEYILDLRGNGGGAFQGALGVAGVFMNDMPITSIVDGGGQQMGFRTKKEALIPTEPMVVWVDGGSASASEVLAGALQDDCRAILVGERSFGKGLVQAVYGLSDGSGVIMTVAKYQTPRGTDIQGKGIYPDVKESLPWLGVQPSQDDFNTAREKQKTCPPLPPLVDSQGA